MLSDFVGARPSNSRHDLDIEPDSISGLVYQESKSRQLRSLARITYPIFALDR